MRVMEDSFDPCFGEAWTAAQFAGMMPLPGIWLSLAKQDDKVIGFGLGRSVLDEAELLLLAVNRDSQHQGIGRSLLNHFVDTATQRGASKLHLEVRDGNPALKLYNAAGFVEAGRRWKYYVGRDGQVYDAVTLEKRIGS
ncbi:MAG: ribosomal protein S18-alanine N-acetyltransferase [Sphingosinicella sp.]|nr:ribosomal protein S18-alanine N-acetyltransferase [Sphingosinicella sp.]